MTALDGAGVPTDAQFMSAREQGLSRLFICLLCSHVVADREVHRGFHRWMNGTARKEPAR